MANSVDPDQAAPIGAVCSGSTLFASILNSSVLLGNYLQQTTSADRCIIFLALLGLIFRQIGPSKKSQLLLNKSNIHAMSTGEKIE